MSGTSDAELNDLLAESYQQALEDAKHLASPCFTNCGEPACQKLGCVRAYNADHRELTVDTPRERFPGYGEDVA